jgi:hypothetical protein
LTLQEGEAERQKPERRAVQDEGLRRQEAVEFEDRRLQACENDAEGARDEQDRPGSPSLGQPQLVPAKC